MWAVDAKKPTKKKKQSNKDPDVSSPKRPNNVSAGLYCIACQAIIRESLKELYHHTGEQEVVEVLENACKPPHVYFEPDMPYMSMDAMRAGCD